MVIDQVKVFQKIPIYTISFSYKDEIANGFLKDLAALTGGEFHAYNFDCKNPCSSEAIQVRAEKRVFIYLNIIGWRPMDDTLFGKTATTKTTMSSK